LSLENIGAKEKIFQAVLELAASEENIENITSRKIAKKANVNLALINYYYQSKEKLLKQAAEIKMASIINQVLGQNDGNEDAVVKLKRLLGTTADFSFRHNDIFRIAVAGELKEGCKNSCELVMPFLREIFKNKSESELKIIVLQLMLPFHHIVLYPDVYKNYFHTDFFDEKQRTQMINKMVDSILPKMEEK